MEVLQFIRHPFDIPATKKNQNVNMPPSRDQRKMLWVLHSIANHCQTHRIHMHWKVKCKEKDDCNAQNREMKTRRAIEHIMEQDQFLKCVVFLKRSWPQYSLKQWDCYWGRLRSWVGMGMRRRLGWSTVFKCTSCGAQFDRDVNGASNILLR